MIYLLPLYQTTLFGLEKRKSYMIKFMNSLRYFQLKTALIDKSVNYLVDSFKEYYFPLLLLQCQIF